MSDRQRSDGHREAKPGVPSAPLSFGRAFPVTWGGAIVSFGLAFVVYLRTLAPTVYGLDSAELTTGAYCLGLVHAPGYPLYLLIGHLFSHLPLGNVAYRMNLMSAFFGALTVSLLFAILSRLVRHPVAALAAALLLAYSFFFWSPSLMAEVYTLHTALLLALILVGLIWQERQHQHWLYLLAFGVGLALGNHLSIILLLPGLTYWLLTISGRRLLQPRLLFTLFLLLALGLSVYLYLPLRYAANPPHVGAMEIEIGSWHDLVDVISARIFWGLVFAYPARQLWAEVIDYLYCLWGNFLGIGLVIGIGGAVLLARQRHGLGMALTWTFLLNTIFFIGYAAGDKRLMFAPTYVVWAIWIGIGYDWLLARIDGLVKGQAHARRWRAGAAAAVLALALVALVVNFRHADLSQDRRTYARADQVLSTIEQDAYVLASSWFQISPIEYLRVVEGRRHDVTLVNAYELDEPGLDQLIATLAPAHPFYTLDRDALPEARYELEYIAVCDCYKILNSLGGERQ